MPELPEVETIRRDLEKKIAGEKIQSIEILAAKSVHNKSSDFLKILIANNFKHIERRGKLLMFALDKVDKYAYLLVHLKMTGQLIYRHKKEILVIHSFGIEPLTPDYTLEAFQKLFKKRQTNIKALLLNQKLISGIGNIYADEVCFCAKIFPTRKVGSLSGLEIKKLFNCIEDVLRVAIENRGTTFNNYVDSAGHTGSHINFLNVYGRDGEKCKRCKGTILKIKHAGRGTHYCANCQK